jgi:chorismate mutase
MTQSPPPFSLADLRREIDRIDETMHRLLMERGEIIETLIEVKKTQASGSAFRPGREADQMKRLAERHQGLLPFDTVESIWRVIVSTFTYVQAPYTVHADTSLGDGLMRDTARFHFGFTVPYRTYRNAQEVIDAVAGSAGDLGIFPAHPDQTSGSWWIPLSGPDKPKIIARLPFVERTDHPAGTPIYVISKPIDDATVREVILYSLNIERWREGLTQALRRHDASIEASAGDDNGLSLLIAAPGSVSTETLADALGGLGIGRFEWHEIGSHAARYHRPDQH